jgi:hypothetical protein
MRINVYRCSRVSRSVIRASLVDEIEVDPADIDEFMEDNGGDFFEVNDDEGYCDWPLPPSR